MTLGACVYGVKEPSWSKPRETQRGSDYRRHEVPYKEWHGAGEGGHSVVQGGSRGQSGRAAMPGSVMGEGR